MANSMEEIAQKRGYTFTDVVLDLLRQELEYMGYNVGIGWDVTEPPVFKKAEIDAMMKGGGEPLILEETQAG